MKVIISLQEFYDALMVVAMDNGRSYVSVKVQLSSNANGIELSGYIDGTSKWISGNTPAEICNAFRSHFHPEEHIVPRITDVEFESDKSTDQQIDEGLADLKKIAAEIPAVAELKPLE